MTARGWIRWAGFGGPLAAAAVITCVGDDGASTASPDASTSGADAGGVELVVDSGIDPATCAARSVDEANAIFVNINGADGPECGAASSPCQTVQAGVDQAKTLGRSIVYVARGTYKETIKLAAGLTLEGGWDTLTGKWIPACGNDTVAAVKLQMPDSAQSVVSADFTGAATLRYLSILGKANAAAGESVYGVFAKDAEIAFEAVSVSVGNAGAGLDGTGGSTGGNGGSNVRRGTALPVHPARQVSVLTSRVVRSINTGSLGPLALRTAPLGPRTTPSRDRCDGLPPAVEPS